jgi:hypothetical protein
MPSLTLTPRGHLLFTVADDILRPSAALSRSVESAFARGSGHGLLELGVAQVGTTLPADFNYWRDFAARFVTTICTHSDLDARERPNLCACARRARSTHRGRAADDGRRVHHGLGP